MRILALSSWYPYPPDNGSRIRIYNLLKHLSAQHEITLLSFDGDGREKAGTDGLRHICRSVHCVPPTPYRPGRVSALLALLSRSPRSIVHTYSRAMGELVVHALSDRSYDVIVAAQIGTAPYVPVSTPIPACFDEIELQVFKDAFTSARTLLGRCRRWLTWLKLQRYLPGLMDRFAACTVVSALEQSNLHEIAPAYKRVHVIPNGVDLDRCKPGLARAVPNTLIYSGSLSYSANKDAVSFFVKDILPGVQAQVPDAELSVTGSLHGVAVDSLPQRQGVKYAGYLDDVRPAIASAWACIVPLRVGGGTRLKILESMALGTPVISTSKGAEGLDVTPEEHLLLADQPSEFAAQTVRLLTDPVLRGYLAGNARQLVEQKYGWTQIGRKLDDLLTSLVSTVPG